jgi:hypothetical protein
MDKKLEKIFNECIDRLLQGETIDDCLKSHPQLADELEPLLLTAIDISWKATKIEPRPEFKSMARARIQSAFIYAQQHKQQKQQKQPKYSGFFSLQRAWVPALSAVLVIVLSSAGTVAASSNALPDETLYPVKEATENTRLAFTFSDAGKAKFYVQLVETRSQEIVEMAIQGKTEIIVEVTEKLTDHLEEADLAIKRVEASAIAKIKPKSIIVVPATPESDSKLPEQPPKPAVAPDKPTSSPAAGKTEDSKVLEKPPTREVTPDKSATPPAIDKTEEPPKTGISSVEPTPQPGDGVTPKIDKVIVPEAEILRRKLKESLSQNLQLLQDALDKTPEQSKVALFKAIETSNKTRIQMQQEIGENGNLRNNLIETSFPLTVLLIILLSETGNLVQFVHPLITLQILVILNLPLSQAQTILQIQIVLLIMTGFLGIVKY